MEERASVSTKEVRRLLDERLPTLNDLRAFVMDELGHQEYQRIEGIQNRVQFVNELLARHSDVLTQIVAALEQRQAPRLQQRKRSAGRVLLGFVIVGSLLLVSALLAIQSRPTKVDSQPQISIIALDQNEDYPDLANRSVPPVLDLGSASSPSRRRDRRPLSAVTSEPTVSQPQIVLAPEPEKPLPTSCSTDSLYVGELESYGLPPCVKRPRIESASGCSCEPGRIGKRCLLSGFADVVGKKHLGGNEEQIRQKYREAGIDLCAKRLNPECRQTKDEDERYLCYCCPD